MTKHEDMVALRNNPDIRYNCAQSVLIPFAEDMGITREQAKGIAANFGSGMGCGSVCGGWIGSDFCCGAAVVSAAAAGISSFFSAATKAR